MVNKSSKITKLISTSITASIETYFLSLQLFLSLPNIFCKQISFTVINSSLSKIGLITHVNAVSMAIDHTGSFKSVLLFLRKECLDETFYSFLRLRGQVKYLPSDLTCSTIRFGLISFFSRSTKYPDMSVSARK